MINNCFYRLKIIWRMNLGLLFKLEMTFVLLKNFIIDYFEDRH
jgi:hypothetical protein